MTASMFSTASVVVRLTSGGHEVEFGLGPSHTFDQVLEVAHSDPDGYLPDHRGVDVSLWALAATLRRAENKLRALCGKPEIILRRDDDSRKAIAADEG